MVSYGAPALPSALARFSLSLVKDATSFDLYGMRLAVRVKQDASGGASSSLQLARVQTKNCRRSNFFCRSKQGLFTAIVGVAIDLLPRAQRVSVIPLCWLHHHPKLNPTNPTSLQWVSFDSTTNIATPQFSQLRYSPAPLACITRRSTRFDTNRLNPVVSHGRRQ